MNTLCCSQHYLYLTGHYTGASFFSCWFSETKALDTVGKKLQEIIQIQAMDKDLDLCCRQNCKALSGKQSRLQWWTVNRGHSQVRNTCPGIRNTFKNKTIEIHPVKVELKVSFSQNIMVSPQMKSGCICHRLCEASIYIRENRGRVHQRDGRQHKPQGLPWILYCLHRLWVPQLNCPVPGDTVSVQ